MNPSVHISDLDRCDFLWKLNRSGLIVSPWESRFIVSFRQSSQPTSWFTPPRRQAVDHMRQKYGGEPEIGMPFPVAAVGPAIKVAAADPAGCEFYIQEGGQQRRCNEPAAFQRRSGFRYCEEHAEAVQANLRRKGQAIHLTKI